MPPADPTPPLTAERLAVAEQCFFSGDSGAEVEAIGRELLAAYAALTTENQVLAGKLADIEAEAQATTTTDTSAVIAALTVQLSHRTAERDAEQRAHERIATLCHEAGITNPDGTSVGVVRAAISALAQRTAERDRMREMLRSLEWCSSETDTWSGESYAACPVCSRTRDNPLNALHPHKATCELAALLAAPTEGR